MAPAGARRQRLPLRFHGVPRGVMKALEIRGPALADATRIMTPDALQFLGRLAEEFGPRRLAMLERRREVQRQIHDGARPDFLPETREIRKSSWTVAPATADLNDRRV